MSKEKAIFAGGCFWCMVEPFEERPGILSITSGYTGGHVDNPTYDQVCGNYTGHVEAVEIIFDNTIISYSELLELYWSLIDPTDPNGQFLDRGDSYRPVIFVDNENQRNIAEASKEKLQSEFNKPIIVPIEDTQTFWLAEDYHQGFYKKNPKRYKAVHKARQRFLTFQRIKRKLSKSKKIS
ncbi:peptide-methionine (S)-S-oxide reductase MsrA [Lactococcus nasutitermitis]|uniref:Peptide methionine sulfoxide reductase MsrA n=1 Tax=Lactococcus nasutitermitis TaxID=1652957 RepID=A0ABV9JIP1_9LACT|nr:peptide-methionine (S)-S-oxide reductase MsrA [Lactococcus nasutitermitis]